MKTTRPSDDPAPDWPAQVEDLAQVAAIDSRASRVETRCADGTMAWRLWGDAAGEPVVLLHGGSGGWTHWVRNLAALVRAGHRVCVPDLPGFGESAPPDGEDVDVVPRWLELGLSEVLGDGPVDLVGFSLGGLVGALWAATHPQRVARLVLVGAPALTDMRGPVVVLKPWTGVAPGPAREALHRHNLRALMLARDESVDGFALALHVANVERDRLRGRRLMRTDLLRRRLPELRCEVRGIWGSQDVLYRGRAEVVSDTLALAPRFGGLEWVADAGHWVQFERAAAFDAALATALAPPRRAP